jgi:hypothetical protein
VIAALVVLAAIAPLLLIYATWFFFLAVMNLARAKRAGTLSKPALVMGMPILWVGLCVDCLCNLTAACLVFLDLPREWLVTQRLKRYAYDAAGDAAAGWRADLARWFAKNLLDDFDPSGKHV